jgi:hypothetical protein
MIICVGNDGDKEGGAGFEFVSQVVNAMKNYFAKDPQGAIQTGPGMPQSYVQMTYHFLKRVFEVNKNGMHLLDGISALNLIVVMLENLQGMIDGEI